MKRHEFLQHLHDQLRPRTYLETGVNFGASMTLSRVPSVGIDPAFNVRYEIQTPVHLARATSDEFFARAKPLAFLPKPVIDLAFIDGMHLAEYALRDYLAVERFTTPASVVVFDDMLPRTQEAAARARTTKVWTGDVYKALEALREYRPDLIVIEVDTTPTGVAVVLLPDSPRDGVMPEYDDGLERAISPDPQDVPAEVLQRSRAVDPARLLRSAGWQALVKARTRPHRPGVQQSVRQAFADVLVGIAA